MPNENGLCVALNPIPFNLLFIIDLLQLEGFCFKEDMKNILLLLLISISMHSAESTFSDKVTQYSILVPFDDGDPSTKNVESESYRIRVYANALNNTSIKIMINRNGDENLDLKSLLDGTKNALRDSGLSINPFKIPDDDSKLGKCFSAKNGNLHQITYLNKVKDSIVNIIISGKDLDAVVALNDWLRKNNK
jgi:hypothetical protein